MITVQEYLMGRDKISPLTEEMSEDTVDIVNKVNRLLEAFGRNRKVTSGYRPEQINKLIKNSAKNSLHKTCRACDLDDFDGRLGIYCLKNQDTILADIGLWLEHPKDTLGWVHVQTVPPHSGRRVFYP